MKGQKNTATQDIDTISLPKDPKKRLIVLAIIAAGAVSLFGSELLASAATALGTYCLLKSVLYPARCQEDSRSAAFGDAFITCCACTLSIALIQLGVCQCLIYPAHIGIVSGLIAYTMLAGSAQDETAVKGLPVTYRPSSRTAEHKDENMD